MINIELDHIKFTDEGKELVSILKKRVKRSMDGTVRKMDSNIKGLANMFSNRMKQKLSELSPEYPASKDLEKASLVKAAEPIGTDEGSGSAREVHSRLYPFRVTMPKHRGTQYGYILGEHEAYFTPPNDVLVRWILDKGTFIYVHPKKKGTDKRRIVKADKPYIASKVAYLMRRKLWGKKIKNIAPDWYRVSPDDQQIEKRLNSLNNLYPAIFKKELDNG